MNAFFNQLSISPDRPVDPLTLQILKLIDGILRKEAIPYMLVGATARDLLLYHVYGHAVTRATYDLDFAILVDSWEQFAAVRQLLLDTPGFIERGRNAQRLYYRPAGTPLETIVDIIPFGQVETRDRTIAWPPDADIVMNVAAFSDVFKASVAVQVESGLSISLPSLPGLAVLKLFAWLDRHDGRDVQDIRRILETYTDAGNVDRLYEEENNELDRVGFDTVLAGAFLLGKDAYRVTDQYVRDRMASALSDNETRRLVQEMARSISIFEDRTELSSALLSGFLRGMGLHNFS